MEKRGTFSSNETVVPWEVSSSRDGHCICWSNSFRERVSVYLKKFVRSGSGFRQGRSNDFWPAFILLCFYSDTNDYSIVIPAKHWKKVHGWNPGSAPGSIRMRIAIYRSLTHANGKGITHVARWESIRKWRRQGSRFFSLSELLPPVWCKGARLGTGSPAAAVAHVDLLPEQATDTLNLNTVAIIYSSQPSDGDGQI